MLFKTFLSCFAFVAPVLATPYKRDGTISVSMRIGPQTQFFKSFIDLPLIATVTNTGSRTAKILKYGTVLDDKLPTQSFVVTRDGNPISFTGIKVSVSLADADDSAFVVLAPGESVEVYHDVSALYDFTTAGAGTYSFNPISNFLVADSTNSETSSKVSGFSKVHPATTNSVEVTIHGDISKRELVTLNSRAKDICTTASKKSFIDASFTEAKTLASTASAYITSKGASDTLYKAYFGTTSTSTVTKILNAVANENSSSRTLSCVDTYSACSSGVIAYTLISSTNIYFCSIFFNEVATSNLCSGTTVASRNVRGGTTLHELTHAVGGTDDVTYGCSADQALSTSNKAINADNYNCFTTQVYANTKC